MDKFNLGVDVVSLDYEGRGVARVEGKTVFIKGALPSEKVCYQITREKKQFIEADVSAVLNSSFERVKPRCSYFDTCGGCALQHVSDSAQVAFKQRILEEQLLRIGKVWPEQILPPIYGLAWHYRDRARLRIKVNQQGRLEMGFLAKKTNKIVDIHACLLLSKCISLRLSDIRSMLQKIVDFGAVVDFIELFSTDIVYALNVCFIKRPSEKVMQYLKRWAEEILNHENNWEVWVQYGHEVAVKTYPEGNSRLAYTLPDFNVQIVYQPGDFTQVNAQLNAVMVNRAIELLNIQHGERIADLFCGLGNFSLPMVRKGASVVGIEGVNQLVERARQAAEFNGCGNNVVFKVADLFEMSESKMASLGRFDKMLLDPPRSGAYAVVKALNSPYLPRKIVYVSCNPGTFARDAAVLVEKGYAFRMVGIMNMFAQTAHVESIAVFDLQAYT